jgi:hypothetical protein
LVGVNRVAVRCHAAHRNPAFVTLSSPTPSIWGPPLSDVCIQHCPEVFDIIYFARTVTKHCARETAGSSECPQYRRAVSYGTPIFGRHGSWTMSIWSSQCFLLRLRSPTTHIEAHAVRRRPVCIPRGIHSASGLPRSLHSRYLSSHQQ